MEHYFRGYREASYNIHTMRHRLSEIIACSPDSDLSSLREIVSESAGPMWAADGRLLWPKVAFKVYSLNHLRWPDRIVWSAFCYHNSVPFGVMILVAHLSGVLKNDDAYVDLLNSWSDSRRSALDRMSNLQTYDRYISSSSGKKKMK